ncbi:MAG: SpoIIE family protein phosphatase [Spirochaetales bacterium]|nr:SpoIIE family protein phosphatase [Spirochaetales bacterium]
MNIQELIIQVTENAAIGLVLFNKDHHAVFTNSFIHKKTGFTPEELQGTGFFDLLFQDSETQTYIKDKIGSCFTRPFENLRTQLHKKSKGVLSVSMSGSPFKKENEVYVTCVIHDLTSQNAYEKVIEAGYDNFQQLTIDLEAAMKKNREQQKILEAYKEKMSRELDIATHVQNALNPKEFPVNKCLDMWGISLPSEELGGDYFDYFQLDEKRIGFLIADVAGHGVAASLLTTMLKAYFEYYTKRYSQPDRLFYSINNTMTNFLQGTGLYFTALYNVLDLSTLKITCCIAGHDPALLFHPGHDKPIKLGEGAEGMVLGLVPDTKYRSVTEQLVPGCRIALFTDGITEARNENGDFYGMDRLQTFLKTVNGSAKECIEKLISNINEFYGQNVPNDDRTVIVVNILNKLKGVEEYFSQTQQLIKEKNYKQAIEVLKSIIDENKQSITAYKLLGKTYAVIGDFENAETCFIRAIELDDSSHDSYYHLGIVKYFLKEYEKAEGCFSKVKNLYGSYKKTDNYLSLIHDLLLKK